MEETIREVKERFIKVYEKIIKEEARIGCSIKNQTNIISERIFPQIKHTTVRASHKNIIMRSAQVAAAHNKMMEVIDRMNQEEQNELFKNIKSMGLSLESDFRSYSEGILKGKMDICTKLVETCERKKMKENAKNLLNDELKLKQTICSIEDLNEKLSQLRAKGQKKKFLNH